MNYENIGKALKHFTSRGYVYFPDAPWEVDREAYYGTKPSDAGPDVIISRGASDRYLVASGEQSFMQMLLDGRFIKRGICVTPCYRQDRLDGWHRQYFMKAELINADDPSRENLVQMLHEASAFFETFLTTKIIETGEDQFDIVAKYSRVELGSYGIRHWQRATTDEPLRRPFTWIYGTACAEPRLSMACSLSTERDD